MKRVLSTISVSFFIGDLWILVGVDNVSPISLVLLLDRLDVKLARSSKSFISKTITNKSRFYLSVAKQFVVNLMKESVI